MRLISVSGVSVKHTTGLLVSSIRAVKRLDFKANSTVVFAERGGRRQDWRDQVLWLRRRLSPAVLPVLRQTAAAAVPAAFGGHSVHQPHHE